MATIPSMRTWSAGEVDTGAFMNAQVRNLGNFLLNRPAFQLYQTVVQSIANNAFTNVAWDTEVTDNDGGHTGSGATYTVQTAGLWLLWGQVAFSGNATGARYTDLQKNGTAIPASQGGFQTVPNSGLLTISVVTTVARFAVGDTASLTAFQTSGAALNTAVSGPAFSSAFGGIWLAA